MSTSPTPAPVHHNADDLPDLRQGVSVIYQGRLPDPTEVIQWGGRPGYIYAFVHAANLGRYRRSGWAMVAGTDNLEVLGPLGTADALVLARGAPIPGGDPANGVRPWFYDPRLLEETGLSSPYPKHPA